MRARSRLRGKQGGDSDETGEEDAAVAAAEKEEMKGGGCRCLEGFFSFFRFRRSLPVTLDSARS